MRLSPLFLKCQLNQAADQIIGAHTALHHQLGIHADAGKARQRIDLVENNSIILYKEIYSGQSFTAKRLESGQGQFPHQIGGFCRNPVGNVQVSAVILIFGFIIVKLFFGCNFAEDRCFGAMIAKNGALYLSSFDKFLYNCLLYYNGFPIVLESQLETL